MKNVVNLSSHEVEKAKLIVIEKVLNFAVSWPSSILVEIIMRCIKDSIKKLADKDKDCIIQHCVVILRRSKPPKINISREEHLALRNLRNNVYLAILRADKGGAIMVMNQ
jgi:hypothetical protein